MAQVHRTTLVAEVAVNFNTSFAVLDSLADLALAWCAPITTLEDCDIARFWLSLKSGTNPSGPVEIYAARAGTNIRPGSDFATLTTYGSSTTTADIDNILACLGAPIKSIMMDTSDKTYTAQCDLWFPGPSCQLFVYNNSNAALNGTFSPHSVYVAGLGPEV